MKTILVTGGAGFIGSHFVRYLLEKHSYRIINLDKLTYAGNLENLKDVASNPRYTFVKGDIGNYVLVEKLMKKCDAVVHFAAESHVDRSIANTQDFIHTNVVGAHVLFTAALKYRAKRFVHISTDEVYGSRMKGFFRESAALRPNSPYSASKTSADVLARCYYATYGLPIMITRSSNNYGPRQYPEKIIPLFVTNLLEGKKVPVYAQGYNVRNWIHVQDNCRAIDLVLHKGGPGEIYNIGSGNYLSNIELTKMILKNMNQPLSMIQHVSDRLGHDFRYAVDCSKIYRLGFKPKVKFKEGLAGTIDWYRQNSSWWKKLK